MMNKFFRSMNLTISLMPRLYFQAGLLTMFFAGNAWAAQPFGCIIEAEQVAEVGSQLIGTIEEIKVERGDRVRKGQAIAVLSADIERAAMEVAQSKARHTADVQAAITNLAFVRQKLARSEELFKKKFISSQALDQARVEYDMSEQKLVQARELQDLSQRELTLAQTQVAQRTIRSPFDGVIAERYLSAGERIEQQPLARIIKVDRLRVQVVIPHTYFGKIRAGEKASVMPDLPDTPAVPARITMVDKAVDPASNTFRAQLLLPNHDLALPAGLRCKVVFDAGVSVARTNSPATSPGSAGSKQPMLRLDSSLSRGEKAVSARQK